MLVAPVSWPQPSVAGQHRGSRRRALQRRRIAVTAKPFDAVPFLVAWLAIGAAIVLCVPAARINTALGATLPFWLIAAPLLDLAWLMRSRWVPWLAGRMRRFPTARARFAAKRVGAATARRTCFR